MERRRLAILGATGSIGMQALDVVRRHPERFRVVALTAHSSAEALFELVREFRPQMAGLVTRPRELPEDVRACEWRFGPECSEYAAAEYGAQDVLAAIVGMAGLPAVMRALERAERVLLANKEALVTGGSLVMDRARRLGRALVPVDSEHSAIFQCLQGAGGNRPARLILTASGGPFRTWSREAMDRATVEQALGHPTWRMGRKITVDCASMMNKGLEVIEARWLFDVPEDRIEVAVHPESTVHSMVEFEDGAILAQLGKPDMRGPIGYALGFPERLSYGGERLRFGGLALSFEPPDEEKFSCLRLARQALRTGGSLPVALNAANEVAVEAFLRKDMPFGGIPQVVERVLDQTEFESTESVEQVYEWDRLARERARRCIQYSM